MPGSTVWCNSSDTFDQGNYFWIYNINFNLDSDLKKQYLYIKLSELIYKCRSLDPLVSLLSKNRIFAKFTFYDHFRNLIFPNQSKAIDDLGLLPLPYSGKNFSVIMSGRDMMGITNRNW
jgi:hypothetical protein